MSDKILDLDRNEEWAGRLVAFLDELSPNLRPDWDGLCTHWSTGTRGKSPSDRWRSKLETLLAPVREETVRCFQEWLPLVGKPAGRPIAKGNLPVLCGILWTAGLLQDNRLLPGLGHSAQMCFMRLAGYGGSHRYGKKERPVVSREAGRACLTAISLNGSENAVEQLRLLRMKLDRQTRSKVDELLEQLASQKTSSRNDGGFHDRTQPPDL